MLHESLIEFYFPTIGYFRVGTYTSAIVDESSP